MSRLIELLPPWRDTVTKTTIIERKIPTTDNSEMNAKEVTISKVVLPKQDLSSFGFVARLGLGRAIMIKNDEAGTATKMAMLAVENDARAKKERMQLLTSLVKELRASRAAEKEKARAYRGEYFNTFMAYRAAEKEKDRAYRNAEKEKDRVYRAAEKEKARAYRGGYFNTFMAYRAAEKEKDRAYRAASQVHRAVRRTPVANPVAVLGFGTLAGGLAAWFAANRTSPKAADSASR